jgi:hypothetical protein
LKKIKFEGSTKQNIANKVISLNSINNSYSFISGDYNESFSMIEYDVRRQRFETIAVDMCLRTLSNALPDSDNTVILLQKNGVISKFILKDNLYELTNCYDTKEFINKCHVIKPL